MAIALSRNHQAQASRQIAVAKTRSQEEIPMPAVPSCHAHQRPSLVSALPSAALFNHLAGPTKRCRPQRPGLPQHTGPLRGLSTHAPGPIAGVAHCGLSR